MKIFDSFSRTKREFKPLEEGKVSMYVCGPTVYDFGHLGHGRSAVAFDVIRRYLIYKGYDVNFVMNYTDIDDKMIQRAEKEGITVKELADKIIPEYNEDYGRLNIMVPDEQPLATGAIDEMIYLTEELEKGGFTYILEDGVYFDITKFEKYGQLSGQNLNELKAGARMQVREDKRNHQDFVLWKFKKEGEPFWPSPWGEGRPGWHIECSAMTYKYLGKSFDIHGGGLDLTFPHHECEIAQTQGVFGDNTFANFWLHNGFINVNDEKMSKSLGNFFTLREIFEKFDPIVVRFMSLQTHYRNPINFSDKLLTQSKAGLERAHGFIRNLKNLQTQEGKVSEEVANIIDAAITGFESSMDEDFDTSGALGAVFELIKKINIYLENNTVTEDDKLAILDFFEKVDFVFACFIQEEEILDDEIEQLIEERNQARKDKNFDRADEIRKLLEDKGIALDDTADGTVWKKL
jgi:cysteinyl-tRNA synthetase